MSEDEERKPNEQGDVWNHTYAEFPSELEQPKRSLEFTDVADRLFLKAHQIRSQDQRLADLLMAAFDRIRLLELANENLRGVTPIR